MTSSAAVDALLSRFFGEGNDLSLVELPADAPELAIWLDEQISHLREDPAAAHVLPRRHDGKTSWYGLAHSRRQLRELAQALEAFTVPTYATIDRRATLSAADPVDAAVIEFTGGHALVLEVVAGSQQHVRHALELFGNLDRRRPRRELVLSRPLGRLLREFEMAIVASAEDESEQLLREIEQTGQLSTQNVVFLRMRRLAGLRRFDDLLRLPELTTVLAIRRPARVSASLFEAVYATELARFEAAGDAKGALEHFEQVVLQRYPALFKSRHGLQTSEAIKSFMLHALVLRPEDTESREQLLVLPDLSSRDEQFLLELADLAEIAISEQRTLEDAVFAVRAGNFDVALAIARDQPASVERAELLIRCAFEIDSIEAMSAAASAVNNLDVDQRDALITSKWYAKPWGHISLALSGESEAITIEAPTSWVEWFRRVVENGAFPNAIQIAERGVVEWSAEQFSSADGEIVAQLLNQEVTSESMRLIRDALPHFLQFLDRAEMPVSHRDLLDDLTVLLLAEEDLGVADVQVAVNLAGTLVEGGLSGDRYRQLIGDLRDLWERVDSPAHLDAALEMLDTLLTYACPDSGARDSFFQIVLASFRRWHRRLRHDQWALLADFALELNSFDDVAAVRPAEEASGTPGGVTASAALSGKTVAIYTLAEAAGVRARDFLSRNFEDIVVEISNDHVASDRLRSLARQADVFLIATRSAKHAATTFIESQRPPGRPVLYASGKGSASLIRALFAYASA